MCGQDKKYATDKYKDIYTELSIVKAKADCDITKLKEQLMVATEALGERRSDGTTAVQGYGESQNTTRPRCPPSHIQVHDLIMQLSPTYHIHTYLGLLCSHH